MRRLGESMEETLNIGFGSACDDYFEPRSMYGRVGQNLQEGWATLIISTFIECVNDEDQSMFWLAREVANKAKEETAFHRLWAEVWIVTKTIYHDGSKGGKHPGEFIDEGWKDISVLAQIRVIPPAEERSSKLLLIMKACADRMSQRRFPNSR